MKELFDLFEIAKHAATLAAAVHRRAMGAGNFQVDTKSSISDLVTVIDRAADCELLKAICATRRNDEIIWAFAGSNNPETS